MSPSIVLGLALLSKAAAGVRLTLSGASFINCLQFSRSRSISPPDSDGTGGTGGASSATGSSGSGEFLAVDGAGSGVLSTVDGASWGKGTDTDLGGGCSGDGATGGVAIFTDCWDSTRPVSASPFSIDGRVQSTSASSNGRVE